MEINTGNKMVKDIGSIRLFIGTYQLLSLFLVISFLSGCSANNGKVTARDVLKQSPDADIFQYETFIYSNITDLEWLEEKKET